MGTLQARKQPFTRSNSLVDNALKEHADWLALEDTPVPIVS